MDRTKEEVEGEIIEETNRMEVKEKWRGYRKKMEKMTRMIHHQN